MKRARAVAALIRIELRELQRHPGRSLLVLVLVAIPVAAVAGGGTLIHITQPTPEERCAAALGRAALAVQGAESLAGVPLPPGARVEQVARGSTELRIPGRRLVANRMAFDPEGLGAGLLRVVAGRAPAGAGEMALSPVLLEGLDRGVGERVSLAHGPPRCITGIVVDPEDLDRPVVLCPSGDEMAAGQRTLLIDIGEREAEELAERLRAAGRSVTVRSEVGAPDPFEAGTVFVLGGLGFVEAALVIAAAFAVGLRRRQREIGLLGGSGASPRGIRASLVFSAITLALLGGVLGVAVGLGAAAGLHPFLDGWNQRSNGPFEASRVHVIGALLLGLVTSVLAVVVPARSATRLPIRVALSGRRPLTESSSRWLWLGLAMVLAGLGSVLWGAWSSSSIGLTSLLGGSVLGVLGLGACCPWILQRLAVRAAPLPLAWRLAVRDAGRFRSRNGPVVTAVLAGMSISIALGVLLESLEPVLSAARPPLRDDQLLISGPGGAEVARQLGAELPCRALAPLEAVYQDGELVSASSGSGDDRRDLGWIVAGDEELLDALGAESGIDALEAGELVVLEPAGSTRDLELRAGGRSLGSPPFRRVSVGQDMTGPKLVLGAEGLERWRLRAGDAPGRGSKPWVMRLETEVTDEVLERARTVAASTVGTTVDAASLHAPRQRVFFHVVLLISFLTGLVVIFIATALTTVESRADAVVLATVGAAPSVMRGHLAARAGYLAFIGCLLAVPAGLIPVLGLLPLANFPLQLAMPWAEILTAVVGFPLIAYGGTWLFAWSRRRSFEASRA